MHDAYFELIFGLLAAIALVYLLIVVNFQSWLDPFIIITALPGALAGIAWSLFLTHTRLSEPALTGAIMTMGTATANSILVVSYARERLEEHGNALQAAIEAGKTRFRPVLMSNQLRAHLAMVEKSEAELRSVNRDLSASEAKYRSLVDLAPFGIFSTRGFDITFSNRYNRVLAGLDPDADDDPEAFRQWIHPEDRERVLTEFARAVQERKPYETVFRFLHRNGMRMERCRSSSTPSARTSSCRLWAIAIIARTIGTGWTGLNSSRTNDWSIFTRLMGSRCR